MIDLDDAPPTTTNGQKGSPGDLASIFGLSPGSDSQSSPPSGKSQRSAIDDILGLFNTPSPSNTTAPINISTPATQPLVASPSLFDVTSAPPPPPPTMPKLAAYTAYDKHDMKITLTPQVSPAKPGVVNILARFQVTGLNSAGNLNFQAAVPKVCSFSIVYLRVVPDHERRHSSFRCYPCLVHRLILGQQKLSKCGWWHQLV